MAVCTLGSAMGVGVEEDCKKGSAVVEVVEVVGVVDCKLDFVVVLKEDCSRWLGNFPDDLSSMAFGLFQKLNRKMNDLNLKIFQ